MFLSVFVSYICACVQHLQEGRKAQQYLDQCWKQMDNVSVAGGAAGTEKGGKSVFGANGGNSSSNEGPLVSQMSFSRKIVSENHELHVRSADLK